MKKCFILLIIISFYIPSIVLPLSFAAINPFSKNSKPVIHPLKELAPHIKVEFQTICDSLTAEENLPKKIATESSQSIILTSKFWQNIDPKKLRTHNWFTARLNRKQKIKLKSLLNFKHTDWKSLILFRHTLDSTIKNIYKISHNTRNPIYKDPVFKWFHRPISLVAFKNIKEAEINFKNQNIASGFLVPDDLKKLQKLKQLAVRLANVFVNRPYQNNTGGLGNKWKLLSKSDLNEVIVFLKQNQANFNRSLVRFDNHYLAAAESISLKPAKEINRSLNIKIIREKVMQTLQLLAKLMEK